MTRPTVASVIEQLKSSWIEDPEFDLIQTIKNTGAKLTKEDIKHLEEFQKTWEEKWKNEDIQRVKNKAEELGCSPQLARFIMNMNENNKTLVEKIERLENEIWLLKNPQQ